MNEEIDMPEISKKNEIFDITDFNKNVDLISGKRIMTDKNSLSEMEAQDPGYIVRNYLNNSYFMKSTKFFENGNTQQKAISFINGYPVGFIYEFNEEGSLIKEINTDEGFDYGWKDILDYCKKNKITLTKGYPKSGGIKTEIYKNELNGKKAWTVSYYDLKDTQHLEVTLDGKTGKLLKKIELELN